MDSQQPTSSCEAGTLFVHGSCKWDPKAGDNPIVMEGGMHAQGVGFYTYKEERVQNIIGWATYNPDQQTEEHLKKIRIIQLQLTTNGTVATATDDRSLKKIYEKKSPAVCAGFNTVSAEQVWYPGVFHDGSFEFSGKLPFTLPHMKVVGSRKLTDKEVEDALEMFAEDNE